MSNNKFYSQFLEWRGKYDGFDAKILDKPRTLVRGESWTSKNPNKLRTLVRSKTQGFFDIEILNDGSNDESGRLGTVGDVYFALDKGRIDDDFLIINPDNLFSFEFNDAYRYFLKRRNLIGLIRIDDEEEVRKRGSARLDIEGKIIEFREKDEDAVFNICSVGVYFFDKSVKKDIGVYLEEGNPSDRFGDFIQWLYKKIDIFGYFLSSDEKIFDIGSIDGYERAKKLWLGV